MKRLGIHGRELVHVIAPFGRYEKIFLAVSLLHLVEGGSREGWIIVWSLLLTLPLVSVLAYYCYQFVIRPSSQTFISFPFPLG